MTCLPPVRAENPDTSRHLHVLVHETAESISSQDPDVSARAWGSGACGRLLMQRSVRTVRVVKSVRGAVPVFRPARFPGPLPEPAVRLSPQRALRKSQVGLTGPWYSVVWIFSTRRSASAAAGSPVFTDATS
jgi:hypothetical protein